MIRPRLPKIASGTRLTTNLVNEIINRTEYAADLLRQYKLVAGNGMYVEPHYDGTRVSYLQPVGGGATPTQPTGIKFIADYLIITYAFSDGRDLDTRTQIYSPIISNTVGWCKSDSASPYLFWGGDNTGTGLESCYIDLTQFLQNDIVLFSTRALWFAARVSGNVNLQIKAYQGGTISKIGFGFINVGGENTASLSLPYNVTLRTNTCVDGELLANISYNKTTKVLKIL